MRHRRDLSVALLAVLMMTMNLAGCAVDGGESNDGSVAVGTQSLAQATGYVGSSLCQECHSSIYNSWVNSQHNKKINTLSP